MSIYCFWACPERKEWIESRPPLQDWVRWPVFDTAALVFEMLRNGAWPSAKVYIDSEDLPWHEEPGWVDVTDEMTRRFKVSLELYRDALQDEAAGARVAREDRLRRLGFEESTPEQRKANLALNVALREWPKD